MAMRDSYNGTPHTQTCSNDQWATFPDSTDEDCWTQFSNVPTSQVGENHASDPAQSLYQCFPEENETSQVDSSSGWLEVDKRYV